MSDRDLRRILQDIIDDLDVGRLRPRRPRRLVKWLGAPVLAASIGLGLGGCQDRAIGHSEDAGVQVDASANEDSAALPVDTGPILSYGIPFEETDAGAFDDEDASMDPPPESLYSAPYYEFDAGAQPDPDPDPDPWVFGALTKTGDSAGDGGRAGPCLV